MDLGQFEQRKKDHIDWSLNANSQAEALSAWDRVHLVHEALPDLNFNEITLSCKTRIGPWATPYFISSMTAGHKQGEAINAKLAKVAEKKSWTLAIGSQRRQLIDVEAQQEWFQIKNNHPQLQLLGNLGIAQLIEFGAGRVSESFAALQPAALFIHLNPLQEALQSEGTTNFKGGLSELEKLVGLAKFPIVIKEVGTGISPKTLLRLDSVGVAAIDVSGAGGTHWGRIETLRSAGQQEIRHPGHAFWNWGLSTVDCLQAARTVDLKAEVWASGGIRNGVHAAKAIALGARAVGVAQPLIEAILISEEKAIALMNDLEKELKIAMFCSGVNSVEDLRNKGASL